MASTATIPISAAPAMNAHYPDHVETSARAPMTVGSLRARRRELLRVAAARGASNVRVFGSVARGDAGPDSDVDFLVDLEPGRSLLDLGGLLMHLQDLLGVSVDVVTPRGLKPRNAARVLAEAIPL